MKIDSGTAPASRECPDCGATVAVDQRFTSWCPACDWNMDPGGAPALEPGRIAALRRRLAHGYGEQLAAEMERHGGGNGGKPPGRDAAALAAAGLSLVVHGMTVVLAVLGVWLIVGGWSTGAQPVIGALLVGLAAALRPRPVRLPKDAPVLYAADAPRLFALIDEVGEAVGTTGVHAVVVEPSYNAAVTTYGFRSRRALFLGLGLWETLPPQERVALLGHELGHFAHGDTRRGIVTAGALHTLATWYYVLAPSEPNGLLDRFVNAVTFLPRCAAYGLLALLEHLTLRASQRAEYLADASAARAGSTPAAVSLMDRLLIGSTVTTGLRRETAAAHMRGGAAGRAAREHAESGLWERLAAHAASVPQQEYERLRRVAALHGHTVDTTHPPTHLRHRVLTAGEPLPAQVDLDDVRAEAVAAELALARAALARDVIRDGTI